MSKKNIILFILPMLLLTIIGCGKNQLSDDDAAEIKSITIYPTSVNIALGSSVQFVSYALDQHSNTMSITPLWEVVGNIGEISPSGLFVAEHIGSGNVNVNYDNIGASASVSVMENDVIDLFHVSGNWISPNDDGKRDCIYIRLVISEDKDIALKIFQRTGECAGLVFETDKAGDYQFAWDGKLLNSSEVISDGEYIVRVFVDDVETEINAEINIDTTKPTLTLSTDLLAFSPNNDDYKDKLTIDYLIVDNLASVVEVQILVLNNGVCCNVLMDESEYDLSASSKQSIWDGYYRDDLALEGIYTLQLKATDLAGNVAIFSSEAITVDVQAPRAQCIAVTSDLLRSTPNFSPNGDGVRDNLILELYISDAYSPIISTDIRAYDMADAEIKTFLENQLQFAGQKYITWEGLNSFGEIAPEGNYKFKIILEDLAGNISAYDSSNDHMPLLAGVGCLDITPPAVEIFEASPNPFTPNNDGVKDTTTFSYTLSETCEGSLRIMKPGGTVLCWYDNFFNVTSNSYVWNGKDESRARSYGGHPSYLSISDLAGNVFTSETIVVTVQ